MGMGAPPRMRHCSKAKPRGKVMTMQRHASWCFGLLVLLGAMLAVAVAPAGAVVRTATYTARISQFTGQDQGIDGAGVFGPVGGNLRGKTAVARFTYDTSLGYSFLFGPNSEGRGSDANAGQVSPVLAATLTINGRTWDPLQGPIGLGDNGSMYTSVAGNTSHTFNRQLFPSTGIYTASLNLFGCCAGPAPTPARLADLVAVRPASVSGTMDFNFYSYASNAYTYRTQLQFVGLGSYQVGGVPEPGAWALLLAGFGLMGCQLRQRQRGDRGQKAAGAAFILPG
jgi:hypothetical protein